MERFDCSGFTVFKEDKASYKMPKDPESREELFEHLKEKGAFDGLITVNANTFNSWCKTEAELSGDLEFRVPGVEAPTPYSIIKFVKARN